MNPSSKTDLLRRLRELGPFRDETEAFQALDATLEVLGGCLTKDERETIGASLPPECARVLRRAPVAVARTSSEFFHHMSARERTSLARAVEHAEIVCRALGETLSPTAQARLLHAVPELASLFEPAPEPEPVPASPEPALDMPHDLAEGRSGGRHPLSSANPADLAHRHSVARSDDPHAETKLSSACGLTQEREARTLATGRPGSSRPLFKGH